VLDQEVVLQHGNLGKIIALPDDHLASDRLPASQEFRFAQDRSPPTTRFAALPSALPLSLHPGRPLDPGYFPAGSLGTRFTHPVNDLGGVVWGTTGIFTPPAAPATPPTLAIPVGRFFRCRGILVVRFVRGRPHRFPRALDFLGQRKLEVLGWLSDLRARLLSAAPATPAASPSTPATTRLVAAVFSFSGVLERLWLFLVSKGRLGVLFGFRERLQWRGWLSFGCEKRLRNVLLKICGQAGEVVARLW
jgi:hypothetical protein